MAQPGLCQDAAQTPEAPKCCCSSHGAAGLRGEVGTCPGYCKLSENYTLTEFWKDPGTRGKEEPEQGISSYLL